MEAERKFSEFSEIGITKETLIELNSLKSKYKELEEREKKISEEFSNSKTNYEQKIMDLEKTCGDFFPKFQVQKKTFFFL